MKSLIVFISCCFLSSSFVVAAPDGTVAQQQSSGPLADVQNMISELFEGFKKNFYGADNEKVVAAIKEQSAAFVNQIQGIMTQLSSDIQEKTPEITKKLTEFRNNVTTIMEKFKTENVPNAQESANELAQKFQDGLQAFVKEATTLTDQFKQNGGKIQEDIAKLTKTAIDTAVETTKTVHEKLKDLAGQAEPAKDAKTGS